MAARVTTNQIWGVIEKQLFAVLAFVTDKGEARSAGIVYAIHDRKVFIATGRETWKTRYIANNPHVSLTVTIAKRIPFMPWIKIPAATITFQGDAIVNTPDNVPGEVLRSLLRGLELDQETRSTIVILCVEPRGEFMTYGVGVPLLTMRRPEQARGRAPVAESAPAGRHPCHAR